MTKIILQFYAGVVQVLKSFCTFIWLYFHFNARKLIAFFFLVYSLKVTKSNKKFINMSVTINCLLICIGKNDLYVIIIVYIAKWTSTVSLRALELQREKSLMDKAGCDCIWEVGKPRALSPAALWPLIIGIFRVFQTNKWHYQAFGSALRLQTGCCT